MLERQLEAISYPKMINSLFEWLHKVKFFPGKYRLIHFLSKVFGQKRVLCKTNKGITIAADVRDLIQRELLYAGYYEPEITDYFYSEIQPGDVFYDIGANIGYYSLLALAKEVKVVSFDPDPINTRILDYHIKLNAFSKEKIDIFTCALGEKNEELEFYRANVANTGISSLKKSENNYLDSFTVEVFSLDYILSHYDLSPPSVLKIDVEGWEYQVLNGAREVFAKSPPRLVFFEADVDKNCKIVDQTIVDFFSSHNYSLKWLARQNGIIEVKENFSATLLNLSEH